MLGIEPAHGRLFGPEVDDIPGAHPVVVLSHRFWQKRFGGGRDVIGESITLNRQPFTVIGVAPAGFEGTFAVGRTDFWAPMMMYETFWTGTVLEYFKDRRALFMFVYGRLRRLLHILVDDPRVSCGDAQQGQSWPLGVTPALFPIAKGVNADSQRLGKANLRQADKAAERGDIFAALEFSLDQAPPLACWDA